MTTKEKIGKVYCIKSYSTDKVYVGSTMKKYLCSRFGGHKYNYKKYLQGNQKYYDSSFQVVKYPDCYIEIISEHPNISRDMLAKIEGESIRNTPNCINKCVAGRTAKEQKSIKNKCIVCNGK